MARPKKSATRRPARVEEQKALENALASLDAAHSAFSNWFGHTLSNDTDAEILWERSRASLHRMHAALVRRRSQ